MSTSEDRKELIKKYVDIWYKKQKDYSEDKNVISFFRGEYGFLSNMYDCKLIYNDIAYLNSESAFQAQKDISRVHEFQYLSGTQAKKLGKQVSLRSDWDKVKLVIMYEILLAKFTQNINLKEKLLSTGDSLLVEGNWWNDQFWGVAYGKGLNMLGRLLMKIREELRER